MYISTEWCNGDEEHEFFSYGEVYDEFLGITHIPLGYVLDTVKYILNHISSKSVPKTP